MTDLPPLDCAGCRKCCMNGNQSSLMSGDDPSQYKVNRLPNGELKLAAGKDGHCVYLGKRGCQIHRSKPRSCRLFDCRLYARAVMSMPDGPGKEIRLRRPSVQEGLRRLALESTSR